MTDEKTDKKLPVYTVRAGQIKVTCWENEYDGKPVRSFNFTKSYKDKKGEWQETQTLFQNDLPKLTEALSECFRREVISN